MVLGMQCFMSQNTLYIAKSWKHETPNVIGIGIELHNNVEPLDSIACSKLYQKSFRTLGIPIQGCY